VRFFYGGKDEMAWSTSDPIGNPLFGPFLVRVGLGGYFALAGLVKLENITVFVDRVRAFGILPNELATLYGLLLPYAEIAVGTLLILGFWTTVASALASLMLSSFIVALGLFPNSQVMVFNKDIILLGGSLSLLYSGSGAMSVDRFRKLG
jgi:uncharacterized membrane protein YphA (DoxX/SURF4 family)